MTKRVLAAILWFYTGWYAGTMLAEFVGVSALLGPIIGAAAAGLIVGDPRRIIWTARTATAAATVQGLASRSRLTWSDPLPRRIDTTESMSAGCLSSPSAHHVRVIFEGCLPPRDPLDAAPT